MICVNSVVTNLGEYRRLNGKDPLKKELISRDQMKETPLRTDVLLCQG